MIKIVPFSKDGKLQKRYQQTDIGTSNLFADMYNDELVFVSDQNEWYSFDGKRWQPDYQLRRYKLLKNMAEYMTQLCFNHFQGEELSNNLKYYFNLTKKTFRDKIVKDAESVNCITSDIFDRHKFLFNCENGTYDIKNRKFRPHSASDFLTDMSNVKYDKSAKAPKFEKYLQDVMYQDKTKIDYMLKWGGLTLTGDTSKECFLILYGEGTRNGKSTFVSTLSYVLGTYSKTARAESFQRKDNQNGGQAASGDIARLKGARLVVANEINKDMRLDIALLKNLTGGDTITARELYRSEMEYVPQFKIVFNTNFLPQMTDNTIFKSNRIHLLEFKRHFSIQERRINLKEELKEETSGIFNLLLSAYYDLEKQGFEIPKDSKDTINVYELNSNRIKQFIAEKITITNNSEDYVQAKVLFDSFSAWIERNAYRSKYGRQSFYEELGRAGLKIQELSKKLPNGNFYKTNWILGIKEKKDEQEYKQKNMFGADTELLEIDPKEMDELPF